MKISGNISVEVLHSARVLALSCSVGASNPEYGSNFHNRDCSTLNDLGPGPYKCYVSSLLKVKVLVYSLVSSSAAVHTTLQASHYLLVRKLSQTFNEEFQVLHISPHTVISTTSSAKILRLITLNGAALVWQRRSNW